MKKILFTIFAISLFLASCSSGSSDSDSISTTTTNQNIAQQGNDLAKSTETVKTFSENKTTVKNSSKSFLRIESSRKDLSIDDSTETVKAYVESGTGSNSVSNYAMSNFGLSEKCTGIEVDVYGNQYLRNVGINWFEYLDNKNPMEFYWFYYTPKNELVIKFRNYDKSQNIDNYETVKSIKAADSHIDSTKHNILKIRTTDSGKVEFYANGYLVYTESKSKLAKAGNIAICYQTVNGQAYTKEKPALAYWNFKSEQIAK